MGWERSSRWRSQHQRPEERKMSRAELFVAGGVGVLVVVGLVLLLALTGGTDTSTAVDEELAGEDLGFGPGGPPTTSVPATPGPGDESAPGAGDDSQDGTSPPNDTNFGDGAGEGDHSAIAPEYPELAAPEPAFDTAEYGFELLHPRATLRSRYELRVVAGNGAPDLVPMLETIVGEFNAEMSTTRLQVNAEPLPEPIPEEDLGGVIQVRVEDLSINCASDEVIAGCAAPDFDGALRITGGNIAIGPAIAARPDAAIAVVRHELGHVLNLDHYEPGFNGTLQRMHPNSGPPALQDGDRNGLRFMGNFDGGPITPDTPPATEFAPRCGIGAPC